MAVTRALLPLEGERGPGAEPPLGLEEIIRAMPGVLDVAFRPDARALLLTLDDARTSLEDVRLLLAQHGYELGIPIAVERDAGG